VIATTDLADVLSGQTKNARRKHELESFTDARSLSEHENLSDMKKNHI